MLSVTQASQYPSIRECTLNEIRDPTMIRGIFLTLGILEGLGIDCLEFSMRMNQPHLADAQSTSFRATGHLPKWTRKVRCISLVEGQSAVLISIGTALKAANQPVRLMV